MSTASRVASRWIEAKGIPSGASKQVREVCKAWVKNALEAAEIAIKEMGDVGQEAKSTRAFWADRLYVEHQKDRRAPRMRGGEWPTNKTDAWIIGDNYDQSPNIIFYPYPKDDRPPWASEGDGLWYYMPNYGSEKLMKNGFREALATAEIMWTG